MNPELEDFIWRLSEHQKLIIRYFDQFLINDMCLEMKIRYKVPFYDGRRWICYLNPIKDFGVELAFLQGKRLSNDQNILDDKGRKIVSGVDIFKLSKSPLEDIKNIVREAVCLDEFVSKK